MLFLFELFLQERQSPPGQGCTVADVAVETAPFDQSVG